MSLNKTEFSQCIREFKFRKLFNEMGWTNDKTSQPIIVDGETFKLEAVAEKSGFKILVCGPNAEGIIPEYNTRKKLETKVTKLFQEHLIIFHDAKNTEQIWQLVVRQTGKPTKVTETRYNTNQDPELLFQRASGIFFELDEEENITIVDVTKRIAENFHQNADKVTKLFYDRFKKEHNSFSDFLSGIDDHIDEWNETHPKDKKENLNKQWYVSLMLNRLMFCYFIQKKGFLDRNKNYLRDKLNLSQAKKGKDKFYSFYRHFLLELFHSGLGAPDHSAELKTEIGKIPYLNGGLFDEHELEKKFDKIKIDDVAFERIFNFFDQYEWHLDTRAKATGKDINPDVIGYIFEKYINDRAQMGAYYTKEDITDYISKNCILPFLFDEAKRNYPKGFVADSEIWQMLKSSGDKYIYDAVKYGVNEELPEDIEIGLNTEEPNLLERRKHWNKSAPSTHGLPTEIWRETVDRRRRYAEVKSKIENGEIETVNDFITYNLNITQFVQDVIDNTNDPDFLKAFYRALNSVTIIDPTCGSGAFLFAAMNILEPLYESSLQRMRNFIEDEDRKNIDDQKTFKNKYPEFRKILEDVQNPAHPNLQYFIYKSIILRNLYGVDIMKEAVEIAKLRLFLKLVATVDANYSKPNLGLEPLPDIDFNIRAGNTLIGYATEGEIDKAFSGKFDFDNDVEKVKEKCEIVARTFTRYKDIQLSYGNDFNDFKDAKIELNKRLKELNEELSGLLHKQTSSLDYDKWHASHQPFHWFAEFYEIIHDKGGFDVIIGNPPYVAMRKIEYSINLSDYKCSDLYGYIIKRNLMILQKNSRYGFIVMHNLAFSRNFPDVRKAIKKTAANAWFSFFARIPAGLFSGDVRVRNCIFLLEKNETAVEKQFHTTRIHRWFSEARDFLLTKLNYSEFQFSDVIPMFNGEILASFFENSKGKPLANYESRHSDNTIYFKQSAYNWIAVSNEPAPCFSQTGRLIAQSKVSDISFASKNTSDFALLLLNGKFFFSKWLTFGDEFDVTRDDLTSIKVPFENLSDSDKETLKALSQEFAESLENTIQYKLNAGKNVGTFKTSKLWHITDKSDLIFLKYLCDNPQEVFDAVENHVSQTIVTVSDEEPEEE